MCEPRPEHAQLAPAEPAVIKARQGAELITSGELRVVDSAGQEVPADGATMGEIIYRGNVIIRAYFKDPEATEAGDGRWMVPQRRCRRNPPGRLCRDP